MTNYKLAILFIIIFVIALLGAFFIYKNQTKLTSTEASPSPEAVLTAPPLPSTSPSPAPQGASANAPAAQPESGSNTVEIKNEGIKVDSPKASSIVTSPLTIAGSANVFGGKVVINIKDANGRILGSTQATACMGYDACSFTTTVDFKKSATQAGIIEVYNPSGTDGSPHYLQQILIRF